MINEVEILRSVYSKLVELAPDGPDLEQVGSQPFPSSDVPQRRPVRALIGAFVLVMLTVGGVAVLGLVSDTDVADTPSTAETIQPDVTSPPTTIEGTAPPATTLPIDKTRGGGAALSTSPWPMPLLVLDPSVWPTELTLTAANDDFTTPDAVLASNELDYLQVFRTDAIRITPPLLWVKTDENGTDFVRSGEAASQASKTFSTDQAEFYVIDTDRFTYLIGAMHDGGTVQVAALGLERDQLIEIALLMHLRSGQPGWDMHTIPSGLELVFEGRPPTIYDEPGLATQHTKWTDDLAPVSLLVQNGGQPQFERRLFEFASKLSDPTRLTPTEVRGQPAVQIQWADSQFLLWRDGSEATAILQTTLRTDITELAKTVIAIAPNEWVNLKTPE